MKYELNAKLEANSERLRRFARLLDRFSNIQNDSKRNEMQRNFMRIVDIEIDVKSK